jgi:hypothetical protein
VICSEIGSAQLRQKTIAIARGSYYITQIVNTVAAPYILNPTAANLKGKAGFIPTGLMVLLLAWSFFRLPETKGRNFEELDIMFGACTHRYGGVDCGWETAHELTTLQPRRCPRGSSRAM